MAAELTADTSVVVPALLESHAMHQISIAALKNVDTLPLHVVLESFSVLTRLPAPDVLTPKLAEWLIEQNFPGEPLVVTADSARTMIRTLAGAGGGGGRVYDALVGLTAADNGYRLLSSDRRAAPTYALVGVDVVTVG